MNRLRIPVLACTLALAGSACGAARPATLAEAPNQARITVVVTNHNWADMVVYLIRSTTRVRLGTVTSMDTRHFELPPVVVGPAADIRLAADPIGARQLFVSPALHVAPGQQVQLTIQNHLAISSVSIW